MSWRSLRTRLPVSIRGVVTVVVAGIAAVGLAGCSSSADTDGSGPLTDEAYRSAMETICTDTTTDLAALPQPPEQISIANFATEAARALTDEAGQSRLLTAPQDMADDHRGFIRNTEQQAAAWTSIATASATGADTLDPLVTTIGQLTLGRNDLVTEMGLGACVRTPR